MLKIYNTMSRKKKGFASIEKGKVGMYVCGMTVYSDAHIGHARTYMAFDIIRHYLEYKGYKVTYVQNITDVDDKIIAAANDEGIDPLEYSRRYAERCFKDLDELGIGKADHYPKASEHIDEMIQMIQQIIANGYGYEVNGDVYFLVKKFDDYGKLSGQRLEEIKAGRIPPDGKKRNPEDFALWKKAKPGESSWDSPWGKGRPGWHIECSLMSSKYLGNPFDIHGGGLDLVFPHHENEIAQAEVATGKKFARYWMHIGLLTIEGEKMSKSLGNIVNVRELLKKYDPEVIRFFYASTHYRSPPDFSRKVMEDAKRGLEKIHRAKDSLEKAGRKASGELKISSKEKNYFKKIEKFRKNFEESMDDDFDTRRAIACIFDFIKETNKFLEENKKPSPELCKYAHDTLVTLGNVLTLFQEKKVVDEAILDELGKLIEKYGEAVQKKDKNLDKLMDSLIKMREKYRKEKDWEKADSIRAELKKLGFEIQDTDKETRWRVK